MPKASPLLYEHHQAILSCLDAITELVTIPDQPAGLPYGREDPGIRKRKRQLARFQKAFRCLERSDLRARERNPEALKKYKEASQPRTSIATLGGVSNVLAHGVVIELSAALVDTLGDLMPVTDDNLDLCVRIVSSLFKPKLDLTDLGKLRAEVEGEYLDLTKVLKGFKVQPPEQPDDEDEPPEDGPGGVGEFWWDGQRVELQTVPWRVLEFVWNQPRREADFQDILDAVWPGETSNIPDGRLKTAVSRAANALMKADSPVEVHTRNARVHIETPD